MKSTSDRKMFYANMPTEEDLVSYLPEPWEHNGVQGLRNKPSLLASFSGTAIVVGTAHCVWQDLEKLKEIGHNCDLIAVGYIGLHILNIKHWVSLHADYLVHLTALRRRFPIFRNSEWPFVHTAMIPHYVKLMPRFMQKNISCVWHLRNSGKDSGIFATQIALALGYNRVILAGLPCDDRGHYYGDFATIKQKLHLVKERWLTLYNENKYSQHSVRSVSGYTRELFGAP